MSELVKQELEKNKEKVVLVFLKNGFRYRGKILDFDDSFVKILDFRSGEEIIAISSIERISKNGGGGQ